MIKKLTLLIIMVILLVLSGCNNKTKYEPSLNEIVTSIEPKHIFEQDGWIFFSNKFDGNKIYKINKLNNKLSKINDDNSIIVKIEGDYILYISKSNNLKMYKVSKDGLERLELENVFMDNNWIYFNTFTQIFRVKKDGTDFTNIYTRSVSGSEMKITEVKDEWIYFNVTSEDGISVERVKSDGTSHEHLKQLSIDE